MCEPPTPFLQHVCRWQSWTFYVNMDGGQYAMKTKSQPRPTRIHGGRAKLTEGAKVEQECAPLGQCSEGGMLGTRDTAGGDIRLRWL